MRMIIPTFLALTLLSAPALGQQPTVSTPTPTPVQSAQQKALSTAYGREIEQQRSQFLQAATSCGAQLVVSQQNTSESQKKIGDLQKQVSDLQKKLATKTDDDASLRPNKK